MASLLSDIENKMTFVTSELLTISLYGIFFNNLFPSKIIHYQQMLYFSL
ncbi:Oxidoreductase, short chain dehydrogenase [Bacillus mycoides]|uniref:Oxidoreductase, short chain dehydrogenase n=1 Tax=Bacillus mycoides TaxID=1405 RepID=C2XR07_BACMY|nr:Oxidoreductase, short chain dehydrogenase [Bacillus mycoides]